MAPSGPLLKRILLPVAIVLAAGFALWRPGPGKALADSGAVHVLVPVVMFLISLRVEGARLAAAVRHPVPLLACLFLLWGVFPPIALGWQALFGPPGDDARTAMMILAAQPSTLATAVVLTAIAGGDAALAVVCTVTSQVLSVVLTPWTLALFVGRSVPVDAWALAVGLLRSVLLPVAVGQLVRWRLARWIDRRATVVAVLTESVVVSFVLMGFSSGRALLWSRPDAALAVFGSVAALHGTMLAVSTGFALLLRLDGAGRIAFTLAASQKTVAAGILVWQTGFPGNPLGPIFVVLHHLVQTVGDSILASQMQRIRIGKTRLFRLT